MEILPLCITFFSIFSHIPLLLASNNSYNILRTTTVLHFSVSMVDGEWGTHAEQEEVRRRIVPCNGPRGTDHHRHMVSQVGGILDGGRGGGVSRRYVEIWR
jgi:hypothetical protein